ncbi:fimbrial protein [Atlantibacter hermannii]|uniref:fimbrial protein n=1 Tax=Atlantibacter hermannii TaxID=565 RepID=UPI0034D43568
MQVINFLFLSSRMSALHNLLSNVAVVLFIVWFPLTGQAKTLTDCQWNAPINYDMSVNRVLSPEENVINYNFTVAKTMAQGSVDQEVSCKCSGIAASTSIVELTAVGSPLRAGSSGFGFLTDHLDVHISGYGDNIEGSANTQIPVSIYPTPIDQMKTKYDLKATEANADVCNDATRPDGAATTKRKFRWNTVEVVFKVTKPIFGVEDIPPTVVASYYACLYYTSACLVGETQHVSDVTLSGSITAPLSCTINAGSVIDIDLGEINRPQFINKGQNPRGYTLRDVDISYHCDDQEARSTTDKILLTLSSDQGVVTNSNRLIAKMIGRDDIGVRMYDENNNNVVLDGSVSFPLSLDQDGNGHIKMTAAPVSTTDTPPVAGVFEGNVTVKMDLK